MGEIVGTGPPWALIGASASALIAVVAASVAVFWGLRSWPIRMQAALGALDDRVAAAEAKCARAVADCATMAEDVDGMLQAVERKRRRAAASASRVDAADEQAPPDPAKERAALVQRARALGFKV